MELPPHAYIVDDDSLFRSALSEMLKRHDIASTCFDDGAAFLAQEPLRTGCLLLDLRMVRVGGLDVLRELERREANICTLVVSSTASVDTAVLAMKLGSDDLLEKPVKEPELLEALSRAWSKYASDPADV